MSTERLVLKVLSGAYSGAELALESSEYLLGSALEADISIEDASLAPNHFKLVLEPGDQGYPLVSVQILSFDQSVKHNDRKVESETFQLRLCDRVQVGDFIFGVGPADDVWTPYEAILERDRQEALAVEQAQQAEAAVQAEKEAADQSEKSADAEADSSQGGEGSSEPEAGAAATDGNAKQEEESSSNDQSKGDDSLNNDESGYDEASSKRKLAILGLVASFVLVMFVGLLMMPVDESQDDQFVKKVAPSTVNPIVSDSRLSIIDPMLSTSNSPVEGRNNSLNINTSEQQSLRNGTGIFSKSHQQLWQPTEEELKVLNSVKKSIRSMFDAFQFSHLRVEKGNERLTVVIRGYTRRVDEWKKLKALIERDITGVNEIIDYVETPWSRKQQLEKMLFDRGLLEETQVYMTDQGLLVKTSLSVRDEQKWSKVEDEYGRLYQNDPPLFRIKDKAPWLEIKSVNFGYEPYLVTADGTKYLVGSHVKNGFILDKITPNGIVLKNDDLVKNLPLP